MTIYLQTVTFVEELCELFKRLVQKIKNTVGT